MGALIRSDLSLQRTHWDEMLSHVLQCLPEEACGLVAGSLKKSQAVYPIRNELRSPTLFRMDPVEQLQAFLDIERNAWEMTAIYHSHPTGPTYPSQTDLTEFAYPGVLFLIWYPTDDAWECSCYNLTGEGYTSIEIKVKEDK